MQNESIIKQVNDYAMQNGVILGLFGIATLTAFKWSLTMPFFGILFEVMLLGSPVFATILTFEVPPAASEQKRTVQFLTRISPCPVHGLLRLVMDMHS